MDKYSKVQETKIGIDKYNYIKPRNLIQRNEQQFTEREKIFASCTSNSRLIATIYKLKRFNKKLNYPAKKNEQKKWIDVSQKEKKYKWSMDTFKDARFH